MASAPGIFIEPDGELAFLADPNEKFGIPIQSGYKAMQHASQFAGHSKIFDEISARIGSLDIPYEDQCSVKYYFDVVSALRNCNGEFGRVVEVGVYMGGASSVLAGCIEKFDFDLDLIDNDDARLRFSYERVRRLYPESTGRIRLFHGDLPSYVKSVMLNDTQTKSIVHHDGAHDFNQVVKDLSSLYYARDQIHSLIIQDTHLRGRINKFIFIDAALYAVFGADLNYFPIGSVHSEHDIEMTSPNKYQGNYFVPGMPEGMVFPFSHNRFKYPHPSMSLDEFL